MSADVRVDRAYGAVSRLAILVARFAWLVLAWRIFVLVLACWISWVCVGVWG